MDVQYATRAETHLLVLEFGWSTKVFCRAEGPSV